MLNRPGVAGAVLQTPLPLLNSFIDSLTCPFPPKVHSTFTLKPYGLGTSLCHMSQVICHMSHVTCHLLPVGILSTGPT